MTIGFFIVLAQVLTAQTKESISTNQIGVKFGGVMGALLSLEIDSETSSGRPSFGPQMGLSYSHYPTSKWKIQMAVDYYKSGVSYQEKINRADTLYQIFTSIDTFSIPTFYTSDVKGEYILHFLELSIKGIYSIRKKLGITFGPRVSGLLHAQNDGRRIVDVGEVAGEQVNFESEEEYLAALFTRAIDDYEEGDNLSKINVGICLGSQFQVSQKFSIYFDSNIDFNSIQKPNENIPYSFRHFYLALGINYSLKI